MLAQPCAKNLLQAVALFPFAAFASVQRFAAIRTGMAMCKAHNTLRRLASVEAVLVAG